MRDSQLRENLRTTVEELVAMNCIPIINENDVVAPPPGMDQDLAGVGGLSSYIMSTGFYIQNFQVVISIVDKMGDLSIHSKRNNLITNKLEICLGCYCCMATLF